MQQTVDIPQGQHLDKVLLQFIDKVVDISVVAQRLIPMVLVFPKTTEVPRLQYIDKEVDVAGMQVVQVLPVVCPLCATIGALCSCSSSTRSSTSPSRCRGFPVVQTACRTKEIPSCWTRWSMPLFYWLCTFQVIDIPVVAQRLAPMVRTVRLTMRFPSCWTLWAMSLWCRWCEFTGAVVKKTVVLPTVALVEKLFVVGEHCGGLHRCSSSTRLQLIVLSSCRVDVLGPCAQAHGQGGHVHRDMAHHN